MRRRAARRNRPTLQLPAPALFLAGALAGVCLGLIVAWAAVPATPAGSAGVLQGLAAEEYAALVALAWSQDGDRPLALSRLAAALPDGSDPAQHLADMACRLASSDFVDSPGGPRALRSMQNLYQLEGRRGCADTLLPALLDDPALLLEAGGTPAPVPTLVPPPDKTPAPSLTPGAGLTATAFPSPTAKVQRRFELAGLGPLCDDANPATLLVYVQEQDGRGIPAMPLRVRWSGGEDRFFSGLKPERGRGYADFTMEAGRPYILDMPGLSGASPEFESVECLDEGVTTWQSWRALYRPAR